MDFTFASDLWRSRRSLFTLVNGEAAHAGAMANHGLPAVRLRPDWSASE